MRRLQTFLASLSMLAMAAAGCGSTRTVPDSDERDEREKAGDNVIGIARGDGTSSETSATEPFACGSTTCRADQYCVNPCCGGAPPRPACTPLLENGECPPGVQKGPCFEFGGADGCYGGTVSPRTPPPPYCVDQPDDVKDVGCRPHKETHFMSCVCA